MERSVCGFNSRTAAMFPPLCRLSEDGLRRPRGLSAAVGSPRVWPHGRTVRFWRTRAACFLGAGATRRIIFSHDPVSSMRLLLALFAGLLLALPSSAHGQVAEERGDPLLGCYELQLGAWSPALSPSGAPLQTPPARFELRPEAGEGPFERGRTVARPVIEGGRTPSAFWERIGTDSVAVTWTDGHVGVVLRLEASDRPLRGVAVARTDAVVMDGHAPPRADAVARPVPCRPVRK